MDLKKIVLLLKWWFIKTDKKTLFESVIDVLIRITSILMFPIIWILLLTISPLIKIKFIFLYRERLGHLIGNTDHFLRKLMVTPDKKNHYLIFCHNPANETVVKLFSKILPVINNEFIFKLMSSFGVFDNRFRQDIPFLFDDRTRFEVPSPYSFSKNENILGSSIHKMMGIKNQDWYVVFHCRDDAFDNIISGTNDDYCKMASYRNANINNYQGSVSLVEKQGGKSIRVGFPVHGPVSFEKNFIYDYSLSEFRSDFADVWMCAKARFMVVTANGTAEFAAMFDVPLIMVNVVPIGAYPLAKDSLYLPKVLCNKFREPLRFSEQLRYFSRVEIAANTFVADQIISDGLLLMENTDLQITNATQEMLRRVNGDWTPREGYFDRLEQLNECYKQFGGFGVPLAAMGEDFLFDLEF